MLKILPHHISTSSSDQTKAHNYVDSTKTSDAPSFQVKVTSRDTIKPYPLTPRHLDTHPLSLLDQFIPNSLFNPIILFYQFDPSYPNNNPSKLATLLKTSLSKTLVDFYPLAGRIQGNYSINCNDEGVEFSEASVSETLMKVINNPNLEELQTLLPFQGIPRHKNILLSVQVNHLFGGGIAISVCICHKIADGVSCSYFLKSWAKKACGEQLELPQFNAFSIIPPLEDLCWFFTNQTIETCNASIKSQPRGRVIFDKKTLDELKSKIGASSVSTVKDPTRVEVVSAFIWSQLVETAASKPEFTRISTALHSVNLRRRMVPPLPESTFGNVAWLARTSPIDVNFDQQSDSLEMIMVDQLRKSFNKIEYNYIKKLISCERDVLELRKEVDYLVNERGKCINFTSLCRFPIYEVDFGMGKPLWACITTSPIKDMVYLSRTRCGEGIEAWIHMRQDDIAMLDNLDRHPMFLLGTSNHV